MTDKRDIKRIPKEQAIKPPENPLYDVFTHQMGAALKLARQINADKNFTVPEYVKRFLDEFGQKQAKA